MTPLVVNARFLTQRVTGVQRYAVEVSRRLKRLRPDIRFVAPRGIIHHELAAELGAETLGRRSGHVWEQAELPRHLGGAGLISLCNAAPIAVRRQIVVIHDTAPFSVPEAHGRAFTLWYRFMTRALARRARRIVTVSRFSAGEIERRLGAPADRIVVAPLGREHALATPADRGVLDRHALAGRPFLLAVGSRAPHKNFDALVRAAARLGPASPLFVIAGGVSARVHAAKDGKADAPPGAGLLHVGPVTDGELRALYEAATGYVHPAYYEGFGLPPLEAMTLGCPVAAARAASLPEVLGEAACWFDPFSDADVAAAAVRLAGDATLRAELRERGLARAAGFSWDSTARAVLAAAQEAL